MANSVDPDQTAPIGAVCSGSTLFAFILKFASNVIPLFHTGHESPELSRIDFLLIRGDS